MKALVFGATGLTGEFLLKELMEDSRYTDIHVFNRKTIGYNNPKVREHIIEFKVLENYHSLISGHHLYCCIGTTIKTAGSREAFRRIDYDIPVSLAKVGFKNNIDKMIVISSLGADENSGNFYLRTKGEMEKNVGMVLGKRSWFVRPSMLLGPRKEFRLAEKSGKILMQLFWFIWIGRLKKYKPVHVKNVAQSMIKIANGEYKKHFFESDTLQEMDAW